MEMPDKAYLYGLTIEINPEWGFWQTGQKVKDDSSIILEQYHHSRIVEALKAENEKLQALLFAVKTTADVVIAHRDELQAKLDAELFGDIIKCANNLVKLINAEGGHGYAVHEKAEILKQAIARAEQKG